MSSPVDHTASIAQIIAEHPATAAVFREYEIDFCCRGDATVPEACRQRHLDAEEVLARLQGAIASAPAQDSSCDQGAPQVSVITHIVKNHHAYERGALPYILSLLPKVAGRHCRRNGQLDALCDLGQDLADTLQAYLEEEERTLFPALAAGGCPVVRGEINRHNQELGLLLSQVRSLANGYVAPDWGDQSYRVLMEELEALEDDMVERMHLENHVLIPDLAG